MNNKIRLFLTVAAVVLVFALGLLAFMFFRPTACGSGDSNYMDVLRARNFTSGVFEADRWRSSSTVLPFRIDVIWEAPDLDSLAYLEYLLFNCGYTEEDLDEYFSDENFEQLMFIDYEDPQKIAQCRAGDVRLYEYQAGFSGKPYLLSQWAKPDDDTRVANFLMVFPLEDAPLMRSYAAKIFPELVTCP